MAFKEFHIAGIGDVTVYKRRGSRTIRLTVTDSGKVKIVIPVWASYKDGIGFAESRRDWIAQHVKGRQQSLLQEGQPIGKAHRLHFMATPSVASARVRIRGNEVIVQHAPALSVTTPLIQKKATDGAMRALKLQAKTLLKQRLDTLAAAHGYTYSSLAIKDLKSRWGSCDQDKHIVLNAYLMQLPWHLIDYVIMHELAHTKVLRHGAPFWEEMQQHVPRAKTLRTELHSYQPVLSTQNTSGMA